MAYRLTLLTALVAVLSIAAPQPAFADDDWPLVFRLTARFDEVTDADGGPKIAPSFYFENGVTFQNDYLWIDFNTPLTVVLVDGFAMLIRVAAGGEADFPFFSAMNPGEAAPGWLTVIELSGGPRVARFGSVRFGLGVYLEHSWVTTRFGPHPIYLQPLDVGPMAKFWLPGESVELSIGVSAGNGWHKHGSFNPFAQVMPVLDVKVTNWLGVHVSGRAQVRGLSFNKYEPKIVTLGPSREAIRGSAAHWNWAVELGPTVRF